MLCCVVLWFAGILLWCHAVWRPVVVCCGVVLCGVLLWCVVVSCCPVVVSCCVASCCGVLWCRAVLLWCRAVASCCGVRVAVSCCGDMGSMQLTHILIHHSFSCSILAMKSAYNVLYQALLLLTRVCMSTPSLPGMTLDFTA